MSSDAKPPETVKNEEKPPLVKTVKIRDILDRRFPFYYNLTYLLFAFSFAAFGAILAVVLISTLASSTSSKLNDHTQNILIIVLVITFIIAVASIVAFLLVIKTKSKKKSITSLLPGYIETFVATEEGFYAMKAGNPLTGTKYMLLYPWNSLSLFTLDEKRKVIGLKAGNTLLKLSAPVNFTITKHTIFAHIPENARVMLVTRKGIRWGMLAGSLALIFMTWLIAGQYYDGITRGMPGDYLCDICSNNLRTTFGKESYVVESNKTTVHEYCWGHGLSYSIIHPAMGTESLIRDIKSEGFDAITHVGFLADLVWLLIIGVVIQISLPRWVTTRPLKQ